MRRLSTDWFFAPVCLIGVVHVVNGVSVLLAPEAAKISALSGLFTGGHSDPIFVAMLLIVVGVMAIVGRFWFAIPQDVRIALIIPQQIVLMIQMGGVIVAVYAGTYPDGYSPSSDWFASAVFIFSDQAALTVMCLSHTVELAVSRRFMQSLAQRDREMLEIKYDLELAARAAAAAQETTWWLTQDWGRQPVNEVPCEDCPRVKLFEMGKV